MSAWMQTVLWLLGIGAYLNLGAAYVLYMRKYVQHDVSLDTLPQRFLRGPFDSKPRNLNELPTCHLTEVSARIYRIVWIFELTCIMVAWNFWLLVQFLKGLLGEFVSFK